MTDRECSNCLFRDEPAYERPCVACNTCRPTVEGEDKWAPADLDTVIAERDAALARVAELEAQLLSVEESRDDLRMQGADDEQRINLLQSHVDSVDSDGWSPVSREAMTGELVRIRFRDGLAIGEAVARYDVDHGEYGVVEWEGWVVPELCASAEVFAWRPTATAPKEKPRNCSTCRFDGAVHPPICRDCLSADGMTGWAPKEEP